MKIGAYGQFPLSLVALCVSINFLIYFVGILLIAPLGKFFVSLYILYCMALETRLLIMSCRDCFYYGKLCAFGKGKMCSLLFKKAAPEKGKEKKISWAGILPDFLVSLIPLSIGGFYLFQKFSWANLFLITFMLIIAFPITGYVRKSVACKYCKQREIGCPAIELFTKNKQMHNIYDNVLKPPLTTHTSRGRRNTNRRQMADGTIHFYLTIT